MWPTSEVSSVLPPCQTTLHWDFLIITEVKKAFDKLLNHFFMIMISGFF